MKRRRAMHELLLVKSVLSICLHRKSHVGLRFKSWLISSLGPGDVTRRHQGFHRSRRRAAGNELTSPMNCRPSAWLTSRHLSRPNQSCKSTSLIEGLFFDRQGLAMLASSQRPMRITHEFKGRKVLEESFVQLLLFVSKTDAGALLIMIAICTMLMTANRMFQ